MTAVVVNGERHYELDGCCGLCGPCFQPERDDDRPSGPCQGWPCPAVLTGGSTPESGSAPSGNSPSTQEQP